MSTPSPRLAQLQMLHAADPRDPFLTYGIALEIAKTGAVDDAILWLDKTLAIDAKYCYAYFQKGKMLAAKGEVAAAKAVLKSGIAIAQTADAHAASEMMELLNGME